MMIVTIILSLFMMLGFFILLWGAVGFVQNKKFFSSAPKDVQNAIMPKEERFKGQHILGYIICFSGLILIFGAMIFGLVDGIKNDYNYLKMLTRLLIMTLSVKAYDILFFDYYLLCHSNFFVFYYPEVKSIVGPHLFGYNKKSQIRETIFLVILSLILSCTTLVI